MILGLHQTFENLIFWIFMPDQLEKMDKVPNPKYSFEISIFISNFKIRLFNCNSQFCCQTPVFWAHITRHWHHFTITSIKTSYHFIKNFLRYVFIHCNIKNQFLFASHLSCLEYPHKVSFMLHLQKFEKACPFSKQFLCTDFKTGSNFLNLKNYIGKILTTNN